MAMQKQSITISSDELITVPQAAKVIGVHFATVYRWIESGTALAMEFGGITFLPINEVERLKKKKAAERATA